MITLLLLSMNNTFSPCYFFLLLMLLSGSVSGQLPRLSQFWFAPHLINPAAMAGSDYAQVTAHYRLQNRDGVGYDALILNGSLPLYYERGNRFGTAGLTLLHNDNYQEGLLATKAVMASYSYELKLKAHHVVVAGIQLGYFNRGIDWSIEQSGPQWKFPANDPNLTTGGQDTRERSGALIINTGIGYLLLDGTGEPRLAVNIGASNLSSSSFHYRDGQISETLPPGYTASVSVLALRTAYYDLSPMLLWQKQQDVNDISGGILLRRALKLGDIEAHHLGFGLFYYSSQAASLFMQLVQSSFIIGVGYDIAMGKAGAQTRNAVETTIGWRINRGRDVNRFKH